MLDADGSGAVSKGEWDALFKRLDRNGDAQLQPPELRLLFEGGSSAGRAPRVGDPAPAVTARKAKDGKPVDLSKVERVTVLVFGSWT